MKTIRTFTVVCLLVATTLLLAQREGQPFLKVKVPFPFLVGEQSFPAGEYLVSTIQPQRTIRISGIEHKASTIQTIATLPAPEPSIDSPLVFHRYGEIYLLEEIWSVGSDVGIALPETRYELEMAKAGVKPRIAAVGDSSSR